jgi:protease-4
MKNFLKIVAGSFIGSAIALTIGILFVFGLINSMVSMAEAKPSVPSSAVMSLDFTTPITEQSTDDFNVNMFTGAVGGKTNGILDFIYSIDKAATDPAIKFIYMNLTDMDAGLTHVEEIRSALQRFRDSGKAIIAYADDYSQKSYYLASVADKVFLNPAGSTTLKGISTTSVFFKDMLDKLGVDVQLIRHGKFKAAAEQLISNKMSEENREQIKAYGDAVWTTWLEAIAESRSKDTVTLNKLADEISVTNAETALKEGLIDGILYKDQLIDTVAHLFGVEKEKDIKIIDNISYYKARKKTDYKTRNKIALVYAEGDIINGKSDENIASDDFVRLLSNIRNDSSYKALVLRVNSPGGSASSAEMIERELKLINAKIPVIVSMGDYAASGGYWISAGADKIFVNNTTLTGSIGVFSMAVNFEKTMKNILKVSSQSVNTNKHSDMMNGYRPLDEAEIKFIETSVEDIYTKFLSLVSEGRNLSVNQVDSIAQGRIWSGKDAVKNRLADETGGLTDAINSAVNAAGLDTYRIEEFPVRKSRIDKILEELAMTKIAVKLTYNPALMFDKAYSALKSEVGVKTMARVPFKIEINK